MARALACLLAFALLAPAALADSKIFPTGGVLYFENEDAGIANRLTVDTAGSRLHFADDADPYGMNFRGSCTPGKVNSAGNPVEVFCAKDQKSLTIQIGPAQDRVTYKVDDVAVTISGQEGADALSAAGAPDTLSGGQGNDVLDGGAGDDQVRGDEGDDTLRGGDGGDTVNGGEGGDAIDGGAGDDTIQASDGYTDTIQCGPGQDSVVADQLDGVTDCERVTRQQVPAVPGQTAAPDTSPPTLSIGGSTSQHGPAVTVLATASEPAEVNASGYLVAGGINTRLRATRATVKVGGGGATLRLRLTAQQRRMVKRDLRRHRRPRALVTVSAVDAAGNTSRPRRLRVALR